MFAVNRLHIGLQYSIKSIEFQIWFSRPWKSIEFCQNVHSLSIEKVWKFWMEKKSQVSEQNFTEAKLFIIYIVFCNV